MKPFIDTDAGRIAPGTKLRILKLDDPYDKTYPGREGTVQFIDDEGQIHGSWGGLALIPWEDSFEIIPDTQTTGE